MNPSKEVFVEQCYNMLKIATNVKVIFPFMKAIKDEVSANMNASLQCWFTVRECVLCLWKGWFYHRSILIKPTIQLACHRCVPWFHPLPHQCVLAAALALIDDLGHGGDINATSTTRPLK